MSSIVTAFSNHGLPIDLSGAAVFEFLAAHARTGIVAIYLGSARHGVKLPSAQAQPPAPAPCWTAGDLNRLGPAFVVNEGDRVVRGFKRAISPMRLRKCFQIPVTTTVPANDLDFPSVFVRSLKLFDKTLTVSIAGPIAREQNHCLRRSGVENPIGHLKLDYLVHRHLAAGRRPPLLLIDSNAKRIKSLPQRVVVRGYRPTNKRVMNQPIADYEIQQISEMNSEGCLVSGFALLTNPAANQPDVGVIPKDIQTHGSLSRPNSCLPRLAKAAMADGLRQSTPTIAVAIDPDYNSTYLLLCVLYGCSWAGEGSARVRRTWKKPCRPLSTGRHWAGYRAIS